MPDLYPQLRGSTSAQPHTYYGDFSRRGSLLRVHATLPWQLHQQGQGPTAQAAFTASSGRVCVVGGSPVHGCIMQFQVLCVAGTLLCLSLVYLPHRRRAACCWSVSAALQSTLNIKHALTQAQSCEGEGEKKKERGRKRGGGKPPQETNPSSV